MRKFERDGVVFSVFERDGETFLCTGSVSGKIKLAYVGEIADFYTVDGATSVVSGTETVEELYGKWLSATEFYRSIGIRY